MTIKNPALNKLIGNKDHQLTLFQFPNAPLWTWIIGTLTAKLVKTGLIHTVATCTALVALLIWAFWELINGDNYVRRIFGGIVLAVSLISRIR